MYHNLEKRCSADYLQIKNGAVHCTASNHYSSICSFTCHYGYHMVQGYSDTRTCLEDGRWSNALPVCESNRCPANESSFAEVSLLQYMT